MRNFLPKHPADPKPWRHRVNLTKLHNSKSIKDDPGYCPYLEIIIPHISLEIYSCSPGPSSRCCDGNSSSNRQQGVSNYQLGWKSGDNIVSGICFVSLWLWEAYILPCCPPLGVIRRGRKLQLQRSDILTKLDTSEIKNRDKTPLSLSNLGTWFPKDTELPSEESKKKKKSESTVKENLAKLKAKMTF